KVRDHEDAFVERKASLDPEELRQVVVAFANSLAEENEGIVLYGVTDNGSIRGVEDPDGLQKSVRRHLQRCYPPVLGVVQTQVDTVEGRPIVAVIVKASADRPHFTGGAWVRKGSETVHASEE